MSTNQPDTRMSFLFDKLFIPCITIIILVLDIEECIIDLKYENNQYRFKVDLFNFSIPK
jgi:hypothetical protein